MSKINSEEKQMLTQALKNAIRTSPEARFLHRLHCVQLVSQNHKAYDVANWFGDDPSSVARWTRHFNTFGVDGLHDDQKTGRIARLNYDQIQALTKDLKQSPLVHGYNKPKWDGRLLVTHLQDHYQVKYSLRQCQRLMKKIKTPVNVIEIHNQKAEQE